MANSGEATSLQEASVEAIILRCGCPGGPLHAGAECPNPRTVNLGTIGYWHRNPVKRALFGVRKALKRAPKENG